MSVEFHNDDGVGVLTLNRPPANAYDAAMLAGLRDAVLRAADDAAVRVVVLRSANPKFFCTGADIGVLQNSSRAQFANFLTIAQEAVDAIARTPKLFIAAIAGHCIGGGLEVALGCDFRWAAAGKYRLGLAEVNLGLSPGMGGTQRLPRLIPRSKALHMMVTGEPVQPEEALALGIVDRLIPEAGFEAEVMAHARKLAAGPTMAQGYIKLSMNHGLEVSLAQGLAIERAHQSQLFASDDVAEGLRSFLEKRPAAFKGQ
jgi:enoyl-CoA hydratase/carnithine racemase